jgi:hypothetical protein
MWSHLGFVTSLVYRYKMAVWVAWNRFDLEFDNEPFFIYYYIL